MDLKKIDKSKQLPQKLVILNWGFMKTAGSLRVFFINQD
jgi:hypothetical protein